MPNEYIAIIFDDFENEMTYFKSQLCNITHKCEASLNSMTGLKWKNMHFVYLFKSSNETVDKYYGLKFLSNSAAIIGTEKRQIISKSKRVSRVFRMGKDFIVRLLQR